MSETPNPPSVTIETLLAHEGWVRGLARSLVLDDARADDVVQETWLTALRDPPRPTGSVRGWLATVVRSRAADARKSERRRGARELEASRPESFGGSVADAAAATETHRSLVAGVMSLDEPYRSAVILRFFEGLPPREVGLRMGVPAETARTRVHRGVEKLRDRLDAQHGERRRWIALVLPVAGLGNEGPGVEPSHVTAGGMAMTTTKTVVFAGIAIALVIGAWWWMSDDAATARVPNTSTEPAVAAMPKPVSRAPRPVADAAPEPAPTPVEPPPPPPDGALVRLRFVDEHGAPLGPDAARERWSAGGTTPVLALVDDRTLRGTSGSGWLLQLVGGAGDALRNVPFAESAEGARLRDRVPKGRWRVVAFPGAAPATASTAFTVASDGAEVPVDIVLAATPMRLVRIVDDSSGTPIAGAALVARFEFGDDAAFVDGATIRTDAAGECRLPVHASDPRPRQRPPTWWATAPGRAASFQVRLDPNTTPDTPLVVKLQGTCDIEGDAFVGDGTPAAGRVVGWRKKGMAITSVCDAAGRFRLAGVPARGKIQLFLVEDPARQSVTGGAVKGEAGTTVHARIGIPAVDGAARLVVRVTAGGVPVTGAAVQCGVGESDARFGATAADGTLTLSGLPAGAALKMHVLLSDARISDDFTADPVGFAPLAPNEERRLTLELPAGVIRVHVVDAAGIAVAAARVAAHPTDKNFAAPAGWNLRAGYGSFAGDDGLATLVGLPVGSACEVNVFDDISGREGKATVVPGTHDAPAEVTVTLGK